MDTAQWPQDLGLVKPMEELVSSANSNSTARPQQQQQQQQQMMERRVRPQKEQALHCPRCNSTNTKFCYYNNYSLTQPRYFCKTCRRYWTEGGSLRNVPVGGGSRKNKRSSSSSSSTTSSTSTTTNSSTTSSLPTLSSSSKIKLSSDMIPMSLSSSSTQNPKFQEGQDLNLAFHLPEFGHEHFPNMESNSTAATAPLSAMELLRSTGGISGRGGLNIPFMPMVSMPMSMAAEYPSGFGMQDYMRSNTLSFPLDSISERTAGGGSISGGYGSSMQGVQDSGQRLLFPFEDSRQQVPSSDDERFDHQNRGQGGGNNPPGFWNGMIGGGDGGSGSW